jgi:hypothetical protein
MRPVIELCNEGRYAPELATLDCNTYNHGDGNGTYVAPPDYLRTDRVYLELIRAGSNANALGRTICAPGRPRTCRTRRQSVPASGCLRD